MREGRDIVVVGASAGGVEALSILFSDLQPEIPVAFFVVLHVPPHSQSKLPSILARNGGLPAEHPRDGQKIEWGRVYVAPPDFHLIVGGGFIRLNHGPTQHYSRPAIDPLFCSAAQVYGQRVVGVLLTGLRRDGVAGLKEIRRRGGLVIVQDPAEAMFSDMPQNALANVEADYCLPVNKIRDLFVGRSNFCSAFSKALPGHVISPVVVNGQNTVTNPISGTQQFFRLSQ